MSNLIGLIRRIPSLRWAAILVASMIAAGCAGKSYPPAPVSAASPNYNLPHRGWGSIKHYCMAQFQNLSTSVPVSP